MRNGKRGRYTLEFKQEAVRLVESGQTLATAARSLGVVEQTLGNWIKLHRAGALKPSHTNPTTPKANSDLQPVVVNHETRSQPHEGIA
jgi:transposase